MAGRVLAFLTLALAASSSAQLSDEMTRAAGGVSKRAKKDKPEELVRAAIVADATAAEPGKPFRLGARFTIAPGWHIYYREPGKTGLATEVKWRLPEGFKAGELRWPEPKTFDADQPDLTSRGYTDELVLFAEVTPPPGLAPGGKAAFAADVSWLVCREDGQCIPGQTEIALELPVGAATRSPEADLIDRFAARVKSGPEATPPPASTPEARPAGAASTGGFKFGQARAAGEEKHSAAWFLFLAFIGGIILNIMPCVLPVLSIKILGFVRQSGEHHRRILHLGLVFAAGVFVSFAAMATVVVVLKGAGSKVGWGLQLQEPRFVILTSGVLLAFALSMLGVFEIELPGAAMRGAAGLQRREGAPGAFFNGVVATALATPCTAPFLAPAVGFALAQPPLVIYLFFFAIAAGLSLPYVLLSAAPGWLKLLPKPGPWMDVFKQLMAFPLLATIVWLLSVLGAETGTEGVTWTLAFLLCVGLGCWILGKGLDLRASPGSRAGSIGGAAALMILGYLYFPESALRAEGRIAASPAAATPNSTGSVRTLGRTAWGAFSPKRVEELAAQGKTVFVDFGAEWCFTCKVNEQGALASEAVQAAFERLNVEPLFADYTRKSPELTDILAQFGRAGVPMYLVFPAGHPDQPVVLPTALTPSMVVEALEKAVKK